MTDADRYDPLYAVSSLDRRYASRIVPLAPHVSEAALMCVRVEVRTEYLLALADLGATPLSFSGNERTDLWALCEEFDVDDTDLAKRPEVKGTAGFSTTNHGVKTVEYFTHTEADESVHPWIHFGLTSEDVNNLAQRLVVKGVVEGVSIPELHDTRGELISFAQKSHDIPMLARIYGRPATSTTFGKEMIVYAARFGRMFARVRAVSDDFAGKFAGTSGVYAAHVTTYPGIDWRALSREFIGSSSLEHTVFAVQVNPCDDPAVPFDTVRGVNNALVDLDRNTWSYVSERYPGQEVVEDETGSSAVPHRVDPVSFESSEGNFSKANTDLRFLAGYVTTSCLQYDLSDSTVRRSIDTAFVHYLVGCKKTRTNLGEVVPNEQVMRDEFDDAPAIIGETVQTILRREGDTQAYGRVKELTCGHEVIPSDFHDLFADPDVNRGIRKELLALTPATYVDLADRLIDDIGN